MTRGFRLRTGHFYLKKQISIFIFGKPELRNKTDGLIQNTCIDIKAEIKVWYPNVWTAFALLELLMSFPQTEESYALICFWWPDKRHLWISLNTLKENVLLMSCQIHVLKSCHKFMKNLETKRMLFKRKKIVSETSWRVYHPLSFELAHFQVFLLSSGRTYGKKKYLVSTNQQKQVRIPPIPGEEGWHFSLFGCRNKGQFSNLGLTGCKRAKVYSRAIQTGQCAGRMDMCA